MVGKRHLLLPLWRIEHGSWIPQMVTLWRFTCSNTPSIQDPYYLLYGSKNSFTTPRFAKKRFQTIFGACKKSWLTPRKINIEPENDGLGRWFYLFQGCILRFHVSSYMYWIFLPQAPSQSRKDQPEKNGQKWGRKTPFCYEDPDLQIYPNPFGSFPFLRGFKIPHRFFFCWRFGSHKERKMKGDKMMSLGKKTTIIWWNSKNLWGDGIWPILFGFDTFHIGMGFGSWANLNDFRWLRTSL